MKVDGGLGPIVTADGFLLKVHSLHNSSNTVTFMIRIPRAGTYLSSVLSAGSNGVFLQESKLYR